MVASSFMYSTLLLPVILTPFLASSVLGQDVQYDAGVVDEAIRSTTGNATAPKKGWTLGECVGVYCVRSNPEESGGKGLAVIGTDSNFERVKTMLDLGAKAKSEGRLARKAAAKEEKAGVAWDIVDAPDKSTKIPVAKRTLRRSNAVIVSSPPVLLASSEILDDQLFDTEEQTKLFNAALSTLPVSTQEDLKAQVAARGVKDLKALLVEVPFELDLSVGEYMQGDPQALWSGNADQMRSKSRQGVYYGLYASPAGLLRHSCRPSAIFRVEPDLGGVLNVVAARRLTEGEEITISFLDILHKRSERQDEHRAWKGEGCKCERCTGKGSTEAEKLKSVKEAGKGLDEILSIQASLRKVLEPGSKLDPIDGDLLTRLIDLYKKEGLEARLATGYEQVAFGWSYMGDEAKAKKFAELSRQAYLLQEGETSNSAVAIGVLGSDVKGHYSWRRLADRLASEKK